MKRITSMCAAALLSVAAFATAQTGGGTHEGHNQGTPATGTTQGTPRGTTTQGGQRGTTQTSGQAAHQMNDREFVAMMVQHHQDGIEMARAAEQKATSTEVKALARKIREGQERELREMKPFATEAARPTGTSGQDHQAHMQQESKKSIERVKNAAGKAVDHAFLEEMTKHHQMAIQMTRDARFQNTQLKQMADKMAANQTREIAELKQAHQRVS